MYQVLVRDEKLKEVSVSYVFVWRITLILSTISSEPLMSISNKHNYKTFSKSPPASLLHCIGNILSHSSGKWRDSLIMAALSFTNGCSEFRLCTIIIHKYLLSNSVIISSKKDNTDTSLTVVFHLVQAFGTVKWFFT